MFIKILFTISCSSFVVYLLTLSLLWVTIINYYSASLYIMRDSIAFFRFIVLSCIFEHSKDGDLNYNTIIIQNTAK